VPATIVGEITHDCERIILMAAGWDHECALANQQLQLLTPLFSKTDPPGGLWVPATWTAVAQLSQTFGAWWKPGPALTEWLYEQVKARTQRPAELAVTPPAGLVPRSYQVEGALEIAATGRFLIFDEQGTGKTVTAILGLVERAHAGHSVLPIVVICPASVVDSWVEHFTAWAPHWNTVAWTGTPDRRARRIGTADVYVTSYQTARRDAPAAPKPKGPLVRLGPVTVVADEVHRMKNAHAAQSHAARRIAANADNFVALSGTPIAKHPADLWPALHAFAPGAWPSKERWVNRYCQSLPGDYDSSVLGLDPRRDFEFRTTILGQHRRVAKADVLAQLPPKVYSVRSVELPPDYRDAYEQMCDTMLADMPTGAELSVMDVRARVGVLIAMASADCDMEITTQVHVDDSGLEYEKDHRHIILKNPSWKVDALLDVLDERPDQSVLAFAPSRQLMMLAGEAATAAGRKVGYVVGEQTMRTRRETVAAFQAGELDLICATTGAGGEGITLTAASTVVFLQRPWSLIESSQSEDRAHRIGSEVHDSIEIIDIVAKNTVDTAIRSVLRANAGQLADLVKDPRIVRQLLGGTTSTRAIAAELEAVS